MEPTTEWQFDTKSGVSR